MEKEKADAHYCVFLDGRAIRNFSEKLQADREIVLAAVNQNGWALMHASKELRDDKEVVYTAVRNYGGALGSASEKLQADKVLVLIAVAQKGDALLHASEELRADKDVVFAAIRQDIRAMKYASPELYADTEFMLAAVAHNQFALRYAVPELCNGGLRDHVLKSIDIHRSFVFFLLAAMHRPMINDGITHHNRHMTPEICILRKLNTHGPHYAVHLKRRIADFAGIPTGRAWMLLCMAAANM